MVATRESLQAPPTRPRIDRRRRRIPVSGMTVQTVIWLILAISGLVTLIPMINVLAKSFSASHAIAQHPLMLFPRAFTVDAYDYIFSTPTLMHAFAISVFVTVAGTFCNLVFTSCAAYALSKTYLPGYRFLMWLVIVPMLISAGLIPTYLTIRSLHLIDNLSVLIVVGLISPFNLVLMRNFFWNLPPELEESAFIDGATHFQVFWHIVLPLSKPVMATVGLFYGAAHWNDYFTGLVYLNDSSKWPLQVVLRSIVINTNMMNMGSANGRSDITQLQVSPENIKAATIIFALVPILFVYPFVQRYFVKGILLGSIKG